jgi:hypothetical protein
LIWDIKKDFEDPMEKAIKKMLSYKGNIPSECMNTYDFEVYLKVAPPHELERDIISEDTMRKMCTFYNF